MFKLPAVICNHFVLVPYFEAKAASSRSSKEILVPIAKAAPGISSRSPSAVVPDPSRAFARACVRPRSRRLRRRQFPLLCHRRARLPPCVRSYQKIGR